VLTAVALARSDGASLREVCVESRVSLRAASVPEIRAYVAGGEPLDKAGAYALQGEGARFVAGVEGSRSNVIGLPLDETLALLREAGIHGQ
jgi:septum formation protein